MFAEVSSPFDGTYVYPDYVHYYSDIPPNSWSSFASISIYNGTGSDVTPNGHPIFYDYDTGITRWRMRQGGSYGYLGYTFESHSPQVSLQPGFTYYILHSVDLRRSIGYQPNGVAGRVITSNSSGSTIQFFPTPVLWKGSFAGIVASQSPGWMELSTLTVSSPVLLSPNWSYVSGYYCLLNSTSDVDVISEPELYYSASSIWIGTSVPALISSLSASVRQISSNIQSQTEVLSSALSALNAQLVTQGTSIKEQISSTGNLLNSTLHSEGLLIRNKLDELLSSDGADTGVNSQVQQSQQQLQQQLTPLESVEQMGTALDSAFKNSGDYTVRFPGIKGPFMPDGTVVEIVPAQDVDLSFLDRFSAVTSAVGLVMLGICAWRTLEFLHGLLMRILGGGGEGVDSF